MRATHSQLPRVTVLTGARRVLADVAALAAHGEEQQWGAAARKVGALALAEAEGGRAERLAGLAEPVRPPA